MRKTYTYCLFLRHPITSECEVHHIDIDSDNKYMDVIEFFNKIIEFDELSEGFTLVGMNIINMKDIVEDGEENE